MVPQTFKLPETARLHAVLMTSAACPVSDLIADEAGEELRRLLPAALAILTVAASALALRARHAVATRIGAAP